MSLAQWSLLFVYAAMTFYTLAFFAFAVSFAAPRGRAHAESVQLVGALTAASGGGAPGVSGPSRSVPPSVVPTAAESAAESREVLPPGRRAANIAMALTWLAGAFLAVAVITRAIWAGRAPWGNMYEFSTAGALAVTAVFLALSLRRDVRFLGLPVSMTVLLTLGIAVLLLYNESATLVPALNSYWLVIHVSAAVVSGGAFTVGAAATVLFLIRERAEARSGGEPGRGFAARLPSSEALDGLAYRVNAFVFPLWTFAVIAGAIWAEDAWGRYWGWDPKETWAFITWVLYAGYLHARATAGWRGRRAAVVGLIAFTAFVINFFGVNLFVSGLHSYAGV